MKINKTFHVNIHVTALMINKKTTVAQINSL